MSSPLQGLKVLVLRPEHQAGELADLFREAGASPEVVPAIHILAPSDWTPIDRALQQLARFDWILFTSLNGVEAFCSRADECGVTPAQFPKKVGAIGPGTARALGRRGIDVQWMPASFTAAALSDQLPDPPARVLLVRADIATRELDNKLTARGFTVTRIDSYRTASADAGPIRDAWAQCGAVALTSASIARSFAAAVADQPREATIASIGPATSAECRRVGLKVDVEASEHTMPGLIAALSAYVAGSEGSTAAP